MQLILPWIQSLCTAIKSLPGLYFLVLCFSQIRHFPLFPKKRGEGRGLKHLTVLNLFVWDQREYHYSSAPQILYISPDFQAMFTSHAEVPCTSAYSSRGQLLTVRQSAHPEALAGIWRSTSLHLGNSERLRLSLLRGSLEPSFPVSAGLCCQIRLLLRSPQGPYKLRPDTPRMDA